MRERQAGRVERHAAEAADGLGERGIPGRRAASPVGLIAEQRMPEGSQMHTDLMRAPGLEPALEERDPRRAAAEALQDPKAGDRPLAPSLLHDRHANARARVAADSEI